MDNTALHSGQIAIIGMACRFPGARDIERFWQNLRDSVESVSFFSAEELRRTGIDRDVLADPNYVRARAVLEEVDLFDAAFFGFNPREAEILDPQHRLLLECAWEAIESSGYPPEMKGIRVGVYAGAGMNSYYLSNLSQHPEIMTLVGSYPTLIANDNNCLATRVSYKLNLKGPSLTVQTACSTSLVAVHLASQSLLSGECDMALAGGVSIHVPQQSGYLYQEGAIYSSDGHCRPFDARAQGTVSGDGVGIVVLKRLEDALAHRDTIHAVIRGSAINNDGSLKIGYTAPSVEGQAEVIAEAQALARVAPESIGYIEAHGTATPLGDPIEIAALTKAFRLGTQKKHFCAVGSVKSNFGHLDAAAGVAGLIKTVLALQHGQIPASLHFHTPNPQIDLDNSPFYVNAMLSEWCAGSTPRRAGVSSFGVGGTNAHVILEEAPARQPSGVARPWQLLVLSAKTTPALEAATHNLAAYLQQHRDQNIADIAYTLQVGRALFSHRRAIVCRDTDDAATVIQTREATRMYTAAANGAQAAVVFMFPGQGAQHVHMAHELYQTERVFRESVDRCSELLKPYIGLDLRDVLYPDERRTTNDEALDTETRRHGDKEDLSLLASPSPGLEPSSQIAIPHPELVRNQPLDQTWLAQPALFVVEYALAALWAAWGVRPRAMIGHSLGEYVVACLSGVFSLEDALRIVAARGRLMQELPAGVMLGVALSREDVQPLLNDQVELAAVNGPARCVLSGPTVALELLQAQLIERAIDCQRLQTSHAFHSRMMEPVLEPFIEQLQSIQMRPPEIPFISNLTGTWISAEQATEPGYWANHLRNTVRFSEGLRTLLDKSTPILLEVGPGQTLTTLAKQSIENTADTPILSSLKPPQAGGSDCASMTSTLGNLWLAGAQIDWLSIHDGETRHRLQLPSYPLQRERYWIEGNTDEASPSQHKHDSQQSPGDAGVQPAGSYHIDEGSSMSAMFVKQSLSASTVTRFDTLVSALKAIFGQLLGIDTSIIGIDTTFLEAGIDSLLLMQASRMIDEKIGIKLTFRQLINDFPTIHLLASYIDQQLPPEMFSVETNERAEDNIVQSQDSSAMLDTQRETEPAPANDSALEQIVAQQLQLMSRQIDLLQSQALARQIGADPIGAQPNPAQQAGPANTAHPPGAHGTTRGSASQASEAASVKRPAEPFVPYRPITRSSGEALSATQQRHLDQLMARHTRRTKESKRLTHDKRRFLADNRVPVGFSLRMKEMVYPIVADTSAGSRIWDIDGNEYIDLTMGFGVHLFGHAPAFITEALEKQIRHGLHLGPQSDLAGHVAEYICDLTGVERVTFCNSGTEAVMVALRIARTVTRRNTIALFAGSYHGTFDGILARSKHMGGKPSAAPLAPGVSPHMIEDVLVLDYDSDQSLDILRAHAHELAAVLVEPVQSRQPDVQPRAFLGQLRELTEKAGVALIFDDIVTGFRVHPGGTQAWFDISADLVTYGKVVGGGMPIGVVAGKTRYMDTIDGGMWSYGDDSYPRADQTMFAGTFCKHPLAMAAALAVLQHMKASGPPLQQNLNARTAGLVDTLNAHFTQQRLPIRLVHFGSLFRFVFSPELRFAEDLFFYHMLEKGIYVWEGRNCFLSTAHTSMDIEAIIRAVKDSVAEVQDGGFLPSPQPPNSQGLIDRLTFPLTAAQKQLWVMAQIGTEASRAYNESVTFHIRGAFDRSALEEAIQTIVRRHESLRTTFALDGEYQQVHQELSVAIPFIDLSQLQGDEHDTQLAEAIAAHLRQPFDLATGPLFRVLIFRREEQNHLLVLILHHIILDGWSMNVLQNELITIYTAERQRKPYHLPQPLQFREYIQWNIQQHSDEAETHEAYWVRQLQGSLPILDLPTDRPRPAVQTYRGDEQYIMLGAELYQQLKNVGVRNGCTVYTLLLAGFSALLHRLTAQKDLIIGVPVAGQSLLPAGMHPEAMIGYCINMLPLRSRIDDRTTFSDLLASTRDRLIEGYHHQNYSFLDLITKLNLKRDLSRALLISATFNMDQQPRGLDTSDHEDIQLLANPKTGAHFDISFNLTESAGGLAMSCYYNSDLLYPQTVRRWLEHYRTLLEGIVVDPARLLVDLPLLQAADLQQLLVDWNATTTDFGHDRCLHELFEEQTARTPHAIAIVFDTTNDERRTTRDRGSGIGGLDGTEPDADSWPLAPDPQHLTYAELNGRANQLAHRLRELGAGPEVRIGLCVDRSIELVVGILGILKAGGAYVPLDPGYPPERLAFMLADVQAPILLTQASLRPILEHAPLPPNADHPLVLCLDADWPWIATASTKEPISGITPENLGYVIYTSGSTGRPKGICIRHRGIVNNLLDLNRSFAIGTSDRVLAISSLSFDMCVYEVLGMLAAGGTIVMPQGLLARDPDHWATLLRQHHVTVWNSAPPLLKLLVDYVADQPALWPRQLRVAILGGDWVPLMLPDQLRALVPELRVVVLGGATEASIHSTVYPVDRIDPGWTSIPYGRPMANQYVYVLDRRLQPVPVGVPGELYLGGMGLARGYFNQPGLTAEKFMPNPFARSQEPAVRSQASRDEGGATNDARCPEDAQTNDQADRLVILSPYHLATQIGERLYKTGDLVRWRMDGWLELLGRIDHMIKIRGLRIELGEINATLERHPAVRESVVLAREDTSADSQLVAYVVPTREQGTGNREQGAAPIANEALSPITCHLSPDELRSFLADRLPRYMVPSVFIVLEALPLSPNGKVDRSLLPAPAVTSAGSEAPHVAPRTPAEALLAGIWAEVLKVEHIGVEDNFFELGGHSLLAMQVIARVRKATGVELSLRSFFDTPTVSAMTLLIEQHQRPSLPSELPAPPVIPRRDRSAAELVADLDQLSDAEIQALLELVSQQE